MHVLINIQELKVNVDKSAVGPSGKQKGFGELVSLIFILMGLKYVRYGVQS